MSNGIGKFLSSSLGQKFVMALTGLLLTGFVLAHLAGNLTIYGDMEGGSTFTAYAQKLHDLGPLLYVMELGLVALFGVHIVMAFKLTAQNKSARPEAYAVKRTFGESTPASRNMYVTGVIVLGCLIAHLIHFRFSEGIAAPASADLFPKVQAVMSEPIWAALYLVFAVVLGIHLTHGFKSAFQSLGANHPRLNVLFQRLAVVLAVLIATGFASFPVVALISWRS